MGKQEGTVRGLQFRAIAALRRELGIDRAGHRSDDERRGRPAADPLMDDEMIDLTAGDARMPRRRLEAYAEPRLSPTWRRSSRLRARVAGGRPSPGRPGACRCRADRPAAAGPRRAAIRRSGSSHEPAGAGSTAMRRGVAAVVLAASLVARRSAAGGAFAARPGGAALRRPALARDADAPDRPPERAVAELARLEARLRGSRGRRARR